MDNLTYYTISWYNIYSGKKLASIRYDKKELTSNRMTYNGSFVEENGSYRTLDLLNNPEDDYRHYLWLHSRNYFGYNYNVSLY